MSPNLTTFAQQNVIYDFKLSHSYYGRVSPRNSSFTGANNEIVFEPYMIDFSNSTACYGNLNFIIFFIQKGIFIF